MSVSVCRVTWVQWGANSCHVMGNLRQTVWLGLRGQLRNGEKQSWILHYQINEQGTMHYC